MHILLSLRPASWIFLLLLGLSACGAPLPPRASPTPRPTTPTTLPASRPTAAPSISPATAAPHSHNKLGIHLLLDDGRHQWPTERWAEHLQSARDLVGEWGHVVELVRSDDLDPMKWQFFFDECARLHLTPVLRLATAFDKDHNWWTAPPRDPDNRYTSTATAYAVFVSAIRWPTDAHYVVVGNEPNHGDEWGGRPDPIAYARFLRDVSEALHAADQYVQVLNAPLDPFTPHTNGQPFVNGMIYLDAESFLDGMLRSDPDVFSTIDVWGSHAYPIGPLSAGPWEQSFQIDLINGASNPDHLDPPPGLFNRGVNGYEWELYKLASYGVRELPVMITETGWRHAETTDPSAADNGREWPTVARVAEYVDLALIGNQGRYPAWPENGWRPWLADARVMAVAFFALDGHPKEWGHTNWLQLDADGRMPGVYPMYEVLRRFGQVYR
jgi:hypothetical protein